MTDPEIIARHFGLDRVAGEVVESDPPHRLVMTWNHTFDDGVTEGPSRVTWEIEPLGAACRLRLVHDDFHGTTRVFEVVGHGWPIVLSGLKSLLETGEPLAIAPATIDVEATDIDALEHREWGRRSNQRVWALLGDGKPAADDDRRAGPRVHASQWHWSHGGGSSRRSAASGCSRTSTRSSATRPRRSATRSDAGRSPRPKATKTSTAYAYEAMARCHGLNGDVDVANEWRDTRGQSRCPHRRRRRPQDLRVRPRGGSVDFGLRRPTSRARAPRRRSRAR